MGSGGGQNLLSFISRRAQACHSGETAEVRNGPSHMCRKVTYLTNEREHVAGDIALGEASSGVCEEIVPFAFERVIISSVPQDGVVL